MYKPEMMSFPFILVVAMVISFGSCQAQTCDDPFDIFFILDGSESLSDENFRDMKKFVIDVTNEYNVANGAVHVGALVYGSDVYSKINLEGRDDRGLLVLDVLTLSRLRGGFTETDKAIAEMRQEFSATGRSNIPSICVVITDGKSLFPDNTIDQAAKARNQGIYMIALGFGSNIYMEELKDIANNDNVAFNTSQFDALVKSATVNAINEAVCAPRSPPRNVRATPLSLYSIRIEWEAPASESNPIQGYRIFYTLDSSQAIALWSSLDVGSSMRTRTLTGLSANRVYTIRILAYSAAGQGPLSESVQALTNSGGPGSEPRNVRATPLNQQTIMVEWDEPVIPNGVIQGYRIFYTTDPTQPANTWRVKDATGSFTMATLSGLSADTVYAVRILAYSSTGQGPLSGTVLVKTNNGVPGSAPRNLRVRSYISRTLILDWDAPDIPNGPIQGYSLYYTMDDTLPLSLWNIKDINGGITMATISDLVAERIYSIRLLAYNSAGEGPLSDVLQVFTFSGVPGSAPRNVRVSAYSSESITVAWDEPVITNGAIQGYRVYYTTDQSRPTTAWNYLDVNSGAFRASLNGLSSDVVYTIRVLAYSVAGRGPLSGPLQVRTTARAIVTTPSPVTTPKSGDLDDSLDCDDCMISENLGYMEYSGYCGKYVQIYGDSDGKRTSVVRKCRDGLFWDRITMTCRRPQDTSCEYDICLTKAIGYTYGVDDLCSGYITCIGGRSHLACCGQNERWSAVTGCDFDPSCSDACGRIDDSRLVYPQYCHTYAIPGDRRNYVQYVEGIGNVTRPCPAGTLYNEADCMCSDIDNRPPDRLDGCEPSANFTFATDFIDASKEMVYAGKSLVDIQGGSAVFAGDGMVNLYRFANAEFRSDLVVSFRFQATGLGDATQALVTNCISSSVFVASVSIKIVPLARTLVMTTDTSDGEKEMSFIYNEAGFNDVIYIYDGTCMIGAVNGNTKSAALTGNIKPRRSGILLGAGSKIGHFSGNMKDFLLYKCMPSSVDVFRGQICN